MARRKLGSKVNVNHDTHDTTGLPSAEDITRPKRPTVDPTRALPGGFGGTEHPFPGLNYPDALRLVATRNLCPCFANLYNID